MYGNAYIYLLAMAAYITPNRKGRCFWECPSHISFMMARLSEDWSMLAGSCEESKKDLPTPFGYQQQKNDHMPIYHKVISSTKILPFSSFFFLALWSVKDVFQTYDKGLSSSWLFTHVLLNFSPGGYSQVLHNLIVKHVYRHFLFHCT